MKRARGRRVAVAGAVLAGAGVLCVALAGGGSPGGGEATRQREVQGALGAAVPTGEALGLEGAAGGREEEGIGDGAGLASTADFLAPSQLEAPGAKKAWAAGVSGGERLLAYADDQLVALGKALSSYFYDRGYPDVEGRLECLRGPEEGARWSVVWFRVAGTRECAAAQMDLLTGAWSVSPAGGGVEGVSDRDVAVATSAANQVELYDLGSLRAVLGAEAGTSLRSQYDAWSRAVGARDGTPFVCLDGIGHDGGDVELAVVYGAPPNGGEAPGYWVSARYDGASGQWAFERREGRP